MVSFLFSNILYPVGEIKRLFKVFFKAMLFFQEPTLPVPHQQLIQQVFLQGQCSPPCMERNA